MTSLERAERARRRSRTGRDSPRRLGTGRARVVFSRMRGGRSNRRSSQGAPPRSSCSSCWARWEIETTNRRNPARRIRGRQGTEKRPETGNLSCGICGAGSRRSSETREVAEIAHRREGEHGEADEAHRPPSSRFFFGREFGSFRLWPLWDFNCIDVRVRALRLDRGERGCCAFSVEAPRSRSSSEFEIVELQELPEPEPPELRALFWVRRPRIPNHGLISIFAEV